MDRGYIDFERLYRFQTSMAYFVTRAKINMKFRVLQSRVVDKNAGLRCDQTIQLTGVDSATDYPQSLRRVKYVDKDTGKSLVFLTNNFELATMTIAKLYKCRWQVELFFKWIKQHLRIKTFFGTSENAVKTQVWIAVCVYVLVAIVKKEHKIDRSITEILQILSIYLFEKIELFSALSSKIDTNPDESRPKPLTLFDF